MTTTLTLLQAQQQGSQYSFLIVILLMGLVFYFLILRPQKKRQKEIEDFRNTLAIGTEVVTAGGIYGKVKHLNEGEAYISIEVDKDVVIKVDRNYVYAKGNQPIQQQ
ncbi:MAG: preprotein translocase subunit YajC [Bacteroidaceae bacterium]|nr:preprotein translocase subunit YajC [Bacteroidaceae bacterium]